MSQNVSDGSNTTVMGTRSVGSAAVGHARPETPPETPPPGSRDQQLRAAWRVRAEATAGEASLGSAAHQVAADRDRWLTTALIALSSAVAAVAGFSGIDAFLTRTQASVAGVVAAVLAATVGVLVNNSHRADHVAAARSYLKLQHDAEDFCEVTAMHGSFDDARNAFLALIAQRDEIPDTVTPISVHSLRSAARRLRNRPGVPDIAADVVATATTTAAGTRITFPGR